MSRKFEERKDEESAVPLLTYDLEDKIHYPTSPTSPTIPKRFQKRTPLPLLQLFILCFVRLAEPIAYTQIFPYINQMMEELKVTDQPSKIGFYSGLVDSIFAVCQLFTIFQWARLSDRIGRKPVILFGLLGVAISTALFGFSKSLVWAIVSRSLAGALSGNVAVVESVIGEITDETNQAQAYPLKGVSWGLGSILGPVIGGNLVNPAKQWPNTFGKIAILEEYPYLFPCLVSALITAFSIVFGIVFLKESLPAKVRKSFNSKTNKTVGIKDILSSHTIRSVLQNYFLLSCVGTSFEVVFVLMSYTPISLGGLARSPEEIGYALAFSGMTFALLQVFLFPVLQHKYSTIPLYRFLMALWPVIFAVLPLLNLVARYSLGNLDESHEHVPAGFLLWTCLIATLGLARIATMSFAANVMLVRNASPSPEALGATFGLSQSVACVARAGAPAFVSSLFALSKKHNLLGGNLVWLIMFMVALIALWSTFHVVDGSEVKESPPAAGGVEYEVLEMKESSSSLSEEP